MSQPMTAQSNDFGIGSMSRNIVHMAVPMTCGAACQRLI